MLIKETNENYKRYITTLLFVFPFDGVDEGGEGVGVVAAIVVAHAAEKKLGRVVGKLG